ncbi:CAP family protein [Lentzea sp. NBRC 102530]|uniref:CAP family protein n=1 Tax=Lentzea sp. NBRC 102530 TaxID=3032201 RepID=UPI0024A337D8|nr:CAP family protein [Lentzea sp. NBRC 102530]GLY46400.1 serine protease [Lentzea sp. NBRC 102530]
MLTVITVALTLSFTTPTAHAVDPFTKTVELINAHRAKHGVPPLSLDSEVSRTAQEWADHLQSTNRFEHRPDNVYGENLYEAGRNRAIDTVIGKALEDWYGESRRYDYDKEMTPSTVDLSVLHFTALIWKSSDRVGVGISQGRNGTYLVVNFAERGNTLNRFKANVLPPTS